MHTSNSKNRLESLDILRGFDLFCLLMFQPILMGILSLSDISVFQPIKDQFEHVEWQGFVFWDIIMPLFMFMSGVTIPFALSKYKQNKNIDFSFWKRLFKRFILLFALGWLVQGNLLALDIHSFRVFSNTLQAIAVGYLFASILFVFLSLRGQLLAVGILFISYLLVFVIWGRMDFTPDGNIAELIDRAIFGKMRDGVYWDEAGWHFSEYYRYTWALSSINFIVTVMLGMFAGTLLKNTKLDQTKKVLYLILIGASLSIVAMAMNPVFPIIKKIWSSSMTLLSGGLCFLLMALFYWMVDVKKWNKPFNWLKPYGMNSIVAYTVFFVVNFRCIGDSLFYGLKQYVGDYYIVIDTAFQAVVVYLIVRYMYRKALFIKI